MIKALFFHAITMAYNMKEKEVLLSNRSSLDQPSPGLCSHLFLFIHSLHQSSLFYFIDWWIRRVKREKRDVRASQAFIHWPYNPFLLLAFLFQEMISMPTDRRKDDGQ